MKNFMFSIFSSLANARQISTLGKLVCNEIKGMVMMNSVNNTGRQSFIKKKMGQKEHSARLLKIQSKRMSENSETNSDAITKTEPTKEKENTTPRTSEGSSEKFGTSQAFKDQFKAFSKFGDTKSDGKHMTLSQSDKWMKQAKVIDGKKVTTTDTGIYFKKFKCLKISLEDYRKFVEDLAKNKKLDVKDIENKMSNCGAPGLSGAAANAKIDSTVERLTDVSKYTGSHKLRFDDSGKGKGLAGRKDVVENSGYVSGYQNKDTYSKTH